MAMNGRRGRRKKARPHPREVRGGLAAVSEAAWTVVVVVVSSPRPRRPSLLASSRPTTPLAGLAEAGRPTNRPPTTPPLSLCRLVAFPSHQCSRIEKPLRPMGGGEGKGKLTAPPGGGEGGGEGIRTHLPSWRASWVSQSWDFQLCRDNTDAVRDGNAIGQSRSKLLQNRKTAVLRNMERYAGDLQGAVTRLR